jgi:lipid-binding SYLF domain-containing protein
VLSATALEARQQLIYPATAECKKCGKILASFVDPRQAFGPDKIIPPQILANAKVAALSLPSSSSSCEV